MKFLNPWALLLLLTVPPLILLYFLKLKRPQIRVASTLLWQKVIEDMRVNSPFQRLKRNLLLLLQLLILLAVILALARPLMMARETVNESLIVLLDNSASMTALEPGGKSRLDIAKAEVSRMVDSLAKDDELMVIAFNEKAGVACGFTGNRRQLKDVVSAVKPTECPTAIEPALLLAKSIANSRSHPRIIIFSDGAFAPPEGVDMTTEVEYRKIGTPRPNLAIVGLDIRRSIHDRSKIEMFVAVENLSQESFAGTMAVSLNDASLDSKYVSVGPQETLSQIFEAVLPAGGILNVRFDAPDALMCDNRAWRVVPPPTARHILVVGDSTFFVERAFKAAPGVTFTSLPAAEYTDTAAAGYTTVIWCAVPRPSVAPCNNIYLGCVPPLEGVAAGAKIDAPDILDWDNTHPVNRFLDYDNLLIASAPALTLPAQAKTLLRSSRTPLIGLLETDKGGGVCIVGFDPMMSNWPLLLSFPLFLNSCLDYFDERESRRIETNIPVGKTITLPPSAGTPTLTLPSGEQVTMTKNQSGETSFSAVDRCGVYRIAAAGGETIAVAANLFDRRESTLDPAETVVMGSKTIKAGNPQKQVNREYWKYLVMIMGAVLLLEWVVYHRRLSV